MAEDKQGSKENRSLTGLRGVAAVFVAAYHFRPHIPEVHLHWILHKGYVSVDLFFMLSGVVMAMTYHRWFAKELRPASYGKYIWLRLARIWPLYVLAVAVALLAQYTLGLPQPALVGEIVPNLLMIQGWGIARSINVPLWSVSTEIVAYLAFPVLVMGAGRMGAWAAATLFAACLVAMKVLILVAPHNVGPLDITQTGSIYPVLRCLIGFTLGLTVWRIAQMPLGKQVASSSWCGLAVAAILLVLIVVNANDLLIYAVFPVLLLCLAFDQGWVARFLGSPVIHWLGVLSFAIYALQAPFFDAVESHIAELTGRLPHGISTLAYYFAAVGGLLLLSVVTHYGYERPSRLAMRALTGRRTPPPAVNG